MPKTFEEQLAVARKMMDRYDVVYSVLAKGEASPYMTDELREELAAAKIHMEKYTVRARKAADD